MKIRQGEAMKTLYGIAWMNYNDHSYTAYPMPFNFIARWLRELLYFLSKPPKTRLTDAYKAGYKEGLKLGEGHGFIKGRRVGSVEGYEQYAKEIRLSFLDIVKRNSSTPSNGVKYNGIMYE